MTFAEASAVTGGPGAWTAEVREGWDIFGVPNGGYLMAMATRAMEVSSGGRQLLSATGHFLNTSSPGPISIDVATLKEGRSLSTLRARASRADRQLVSVIAVFGAGDRSVSGHDLVLAKPPDLPPPDECVAMIPSDDAPLPPPFSGKVDVRIHPEDAKAYDGTQTKDPVVRGWFRLRDGEPFDAHSVVMSTDAFPPAIFGSTLPVGWTPTIELTVQVRDPAPEGWLACRFTTRVVTSGMLEEDGELWDTRGNPVALSRQLALVPR